MKPKESKKIAKSEKRACLKKFFKKISIYDLRFGLQLPIWHFLKISLLLSSSLFLSHCLWTALSDLSLLFISYLSGSKWFFSFPEGIYELFSIWITQNVAFNLIYDYHFSDYVLLALQEFWSFSFDGPLWVLQFLSQSFCYVFPDVVYSFCVFVLSTNLSHCLSLFLFLSPLYASLPLSFTLSLSLSVSLCDFLSFFFYPTFPVLCFFSLWHIFSHKLWLNSSNWFSALLSNTFFYGFLPFSEEQQKVC